MSALMSLVLYALKRNYPPSIKGLGEWAVITSYALFILLFSISLVLMASERQRTELEHLATHDSLTNALTRRQMNEVCQQELERCRRHGRPGALLHREHWRHHQSTRH